MTKRLLFLFSILFAVCASNADDLWGASTQDDLWGDENKSSDFATDKYKTKGQIPTTKQWEDLRLYSYEECLANKRNQIENGRRVDIECNKWFQRRILQDVAEQTVVITPAYPPLEYGELDESFEYNYAREPHPRYRKRGNVPAFDMIKFSINTHRGCFGGCSFCAINAHQGKFIASRSRESILREVDLITKMDGFAGTITAFAIVEEV